MNRKRILFGYLLFFFAGILPNAVVGQNQQEQLAMQYFKNQEYDKAGSLFYELYQQQPNNYYYSHLFQCLIQQQSYREAEQIVNRQIKRYPQIQRYQIDLGWVYEQEGNISKAKKQYENCIQRPEHNSQSLKELANAFLSYGHSEYALSCYEQIRKRNGDPRANAYEMAVLYTRLGDRTKAMKEYLDWATERKENVSALETELTTWLADDPDGQKLEIIRQQLIARNNREPDQECFAEMLLWLTLQQNEYGQAVRQAMAMDKRFGGEGRKVYETANIAAGNKAYDAALEGYQYILKRYNEFSLCHAAALSGSLQTQYMQITETYPPHPDDIRQLESALDSFFRQHSLQDEFLDLYLTSVELQALYRKNYDRASDLLKTAINGNRLSPKERSICKLKMGDIYQLQGELWEASLLYSQVEKDFPHDTLGQEAKFRNAELAFHMGEFEWAKAQLDVLRAATSKLVANDAMYLSLLIADHEGEDSINLPLQYYARADFYFECQEYEKAERLLDSIALLRQSHQLEDDILFRKSELAVVRKEYDKADRLLADFIERFPDELLTDDALYRRALLRESELQDPLTAMDLYQRLLKTFPDSMYAPDARGHYRALRSKNNL